MDNLCAIIDVNRLGQSDPAPLQHDMEQYKARMESFGFHAIVVDGHDVEELLKAFAEAAATKGKPTMILAKTYKGRDFPEMEDKMNWHGKALGAKSAEVLEHLKAKLISPTFEAEVKAPIVDAPEVDITNIKLSEPPNYKKGDKLATRQAYGTALVKVGKNNDRVCGLDGDMKNSTFSQELRKIFPERYLYFYKYKFCFSFFEMRQNSFLGSSKTSFYIVFFYQIEKTGQYGEARKILYT